MPVNYTTLINKEKLIKDSYYKNLALVDYNNVFDEKIQIEKTTLKAFLELKNFLEMKNIYICIDEAYRNFEAQQKITDEFTMKYGEKYAQQYVAPIRASEHHTGLAIDLAIKVDGKFLRENEELMANEDLFLEINKYLHQFGFILRYPQGKEQITGYSYEPWHIRYVGKVVASIIYKCNLTLEEYLSNFSGILVVNKQKNMTSRDVVNEVSKILGIKKIGHTGTLDPMAEGVLVLTIGKATKLGDLLTSYEKEYIAEVEIGKLTDTLDITGNILDQKEPSVNLNYKEICHSFEKKYLQEVPIYSAVKVNGKKLYQYARNNEEVSLPKKEVEIKKIELLDINKTTFKFKTLVSKGTYIRSLIRDMGESVNEYFCMKNLIRTKQGNFLIDNSYTLDKIKGNQFKILTIEEVLSSYPIVYIEDKNLLKQVSNGCRINNSYNIKDKVLFMYNNKIIAIYENDKNVLKIWKMI